MRVALRRAAGQRFGRDGVERVVWQMRDTIQSELGLPSSAGVGATRTVAKIASGLAKPAGVLMLPSGSLQTRFGATAERVRRALDPSTGSGLCWRARKRENRARTVTLKLRYSDFETLTRARTLDQPTNEEQRVYATVRRLLRTAWARKLPLRLVGVALSNLSGPSPQLDLFGGESQSRSLGPAIDAVRARFGYDAIRPGTTGDTRWLEQRPATRDPSAEKDSEGLPEDPDIE